ncbi:MAG TPA: 50S ribosomal protein L4 [bacterium]|nr:50S ribosomal protein L4 [bacterium]
MLINTYNQSGEKTGQIELPKEIFEISLNSNLVHQVAVSQMANKRQVIAHTKTRANVSGGGKKPWRQKGTGRARHGSTRSPIWKGGGVTFGPSNERVFKKRIPKNMKRKALFMVLTSKIKEKSLIVLDDLKLENAKTKLMAEIIKNLRIKIKDFKKGSIFIALSKKDNNIIKTCRNIPKINTIQAKDLNVLDLLSFKYLIITKQGIELIKKTFLK